MEVRSRQSSQAVVEFGLVALLFTLLVFATIDFGLLLNTWLSVSSGSREIARSASVGKQATFLSDESSNMQVFAVSTAGFAGRCCDASSAVEVKVDYYKGGPVGACPPWMSGCNPIAQNLIDPLYPAGDLGTVGTSGSCPPPGALCRPISDDLVQVTVIAHGAQVITPLVRPFFGCSNGVNPNCNVELRSTTTMRYEGAEF